MSIVARRHDVNANPLFQWRRQMLAKSTFKTLEELRQALLAFRETYNDTWLIEHHGSLNPGEHRQRRLQALAWAAQASVRCPKNRGRYSVPHHMSGGSAVSVRKAAILPSQQAKPSCNDGAACRSGPGGTVQGCCWVCGTRSAERQLAEHFRRQRPALQRLRVVILPKTGIGRATAPAVETGATPSPRRRPEAGPIPTRSRPVISPLSP